jgi:MFS family permease
VEVARRALIGRLFLDNTDMRFRDRTFASLRRHRNFRLWFGGQLVSLSGTWMQDTALPWLILERTHSSVQVGLLLFCRYLPFTLFGLLAGAVADRVDNRRFLMFDQAVAMVVAAALACVALLDGPLALIYLLAVLGGAAVVFESPNRQALAYQLVGRAELPNAVALNSSLQNAGRVVGPAIAGVVIAAAGVGVCFALNAASFLAVLAALALMRVDEMVPLDRPEHPEGSVRAIREGIAYAWRSPGVRLLVLTVAVVAAVGFNFRVLVPVLTGKTLEAGPHTLGVLFTCFGLGALAGALVAASAERPRWSRLLVGLGGLGVAMIALALVPTVVTSAVLLAIIGVCFSLWSATAQTILQLTAPDRLRGRMISLYVFLFGGLAPVGALLSGWLAAVGGTRLAFLVAGVSAVATAVYAAYRIRELQSITTSARAVEYVDPQL